MTIKTKIQTIKTKIPTTNDSSIDKIFPLKLNGWEFESP